MDRRLPTWFALVHPLAVWAYLGRWHRTSLYLASYDDAFRVKHAWEAGHGALFPAELWPPLPFWLSGLLLRLWPDGRIVPGLCGEAFTVLGLAALGDLALTFGLGPLAAAATVLFAGSLPWVLALAPSALAEPYAQGLLLAALALHARGNTRGAAIAVSLAGMCRYEAWAFAPLLLGLDGRRRSRWSALPFVFPLLWLGLEAMWTNNPFFFGAEARQGMEVDHPEGWLSAIPGDIAAAVGPAGLLGLVGLPLLPREARPTLLAGAVFLTIVITADALGFAGLHNTARHFVLPAMLLALPAGAVVDALLGSGTRLAALPVVLATVGLEWAVQKPAPNGVVPGLARLGDQVRSMITARELRPGATLLIEAQPEDTQALWVATGHLDRVVFDRDPGVVPLDRPETPAERAENPSLFDLPDAGMQKRLRDAHVGAVLARTPSVVARVGTLGRKIASDEGWTLVKLGD